MRSGEGGGRLNMKHFLKSSNFFKIKIAIYNYTLLYVTPAFHQNICNGRITVIHQEKITVTFFKIGNK